MAKVSLILRYFRRNRRKLMSITMQPQSAIRLIDVPFEKERVYQAAEQ